MCQMFEYLMDCGHIEATLSTCGQHDDMKRKDIPMSFRYETESTGVCEICLLSPDFFTEPLRVTALQVTNTKIEASNVVAEDFFAHEESIPWEEMKVKYHNVPIFEGPLPKHDMGWLQEMIARVTVSLHCSQLHYPQNPERLLHRQQLILNMQAAWQMGIRWEQAMKQTLEMATKEREEKVGPQPNFYIKLSIEEDLDENERDCCICKEKYEEGIEKEPAVEIPCGHIVGERCLQAFWLANERVLTCPQCKEIFNHKDYALMTVHVESPWWLLLLKGDGEREMLVVPKVNFVVPGLEAEAARRGFLGRAFNMLFRLF
ncbi:hypothetical protein B0J14DRAFT_649586 [Halenospora varia]|nr:hypothetical protein B0J14DRAFT_649586 [Halenospora varia]